MDVAEFGDADLLAAVAGSVPSAVYATDTSGRVVLWNPAAERLFGWLEAEVLGGPAPHVPRAAAEEAEAARRQALAGQPVGAREARRLRRDGSTLDVTLSEFPVRRATGAVTGSVVVTDAAGGEQRAAAALAEAERRLALLGSYSRSFIIRYRIKPSPALDYVSPSCESVTGYTQSEFAADPRLFYWRIHPADRPLTPVPHDGLHPASWPAAALRWLRKDGRVIWLERREAALRDQPDGTRVSEAVVCEVTDRMQALETARESQEWQAALLRAIPVVVVRVRGDDGPRVVWISDSVEAATGFSPAPFLDNDGFWLERIHPAERAAVLENHEAAESLAGQVVRFSWRCSDDSYRWFGARELLLDPAEQTPGERVIAISPAMLPAAGADGGAPGPSAGAAVPRTSTHWRRLVISRPPASPESAGPPEQCGNCGSRSVVRHSRQVRRIDGGRTEVEVVRYRCRDCGATFTWHPEGVGRSLLGEAAKQVCQVLYGLGLSKQQVSELLAEAGVRVSAGTVWRDARLLGSQMRQAAPAGTRCLLPGQEAPAGTDFAIVERVQVAGPSTPETVLELLVWEHTGRMLPWLRHHLAAIGLQCEVLVL
jgi:PAS domain S-box-containing protein